EVKYQSLLFREAEEYFLEFFLYFLSSEIGTVIQIRFHYFLVVFQREEEMPFLFFEEVKAFIDGDPIEPGKQAGISFKFADIFKGFNKGVLKYVIGIFVDDHHLSDNAIDPHLIIFYQNPEALLLGGRVSD